METILERLRGNLEEALREAVGALLPSESELLSPELAPSTSAQFGHYQCNSALRLAKELKKSPREIAQNIVNSLNCKTTEGELMVEKVEIAGAGFINLTLAPSFLSSEIDLMLRDDHYGAPSPTLRERVIVEFSSPNVAKELHVGHLRSTIIGDCLARLFEFLGHDVLRLNHIGDWGTQFGMLIAYLEELGFDQLDQGVDLSQLMHWYRESKKRFDADPDFKKKAHAKVVALQSGDSVCVSVWEKICEISRRGFEEIYKLLDVKLVERGESFYNPYLKEIIDDLEDKGIITLSEGAKCIFLEGFETREGTPLPMIVQKSDGGYNYDTTDLAALRHRVTEEKAEHIIYVTDSGQALHFQMLFKAAEKGGYYDPQKVHIDHVTFGVVLGSDGKKFKTRSGETEKLVDLLTTAISEAKKILKERLGDLSEAELDRLSHILGIDAVKYADLSCHRLKDYTFSYERMLKFEGNTAAFLLYAYVRILGIKRKVGKEISDLLQKTSVDLQHPSEISLALKIRRLPEVLEMVTRDLLPNRLCEYLYELAEEFHAFFRDCRVEGVPEEESRLLVCEAVARILEKGLNLLGLKTMDRM